MASSFADEFSDWLTESVLVEPYLGAGMNGDQYGAAATVGNAETGLMVEDVRRLVRSSTGNEVVSETTIYVPSELAGQIPLHARVTLPDGRVSKVIRVASFSPYGPDEHQVVNVE